MTTGIGFYPIGEFYVGEFEGLPPAPPPFGDDDFASAMTRLLPQGRVWLASLTSLQAAFLAAMAPTYTRSTASAAQLLVDAFPTSTYNLLEEWEESLGLPDPCTAANPTIAQRQASVAAKWGSRGALTLQYFVDLAASLGFSITITEFTSFVAGTPCGLPARGPAWAMSWEVNAPQVATSRLTAGEPCGEPLMSYDAGELVCRITRDTPAGTTVFFVFS